MNDETKAWYKEAQRKCQKAYNKYEASGFAQVEYVPYLEAMTDVAEYYIQVCDFEKDAFKPDW